MKIRAQWGSSWEVAISGKKSWNVVYLGRFGAFSSGWRCVVKEYPLVVGDTCKFTFIKPDELLLVVSKP
ncbi:hypothetical protein ARALYDRAFT_900280 [Arabidopsis lyrata subsp. lyrata]|uniref:TF-B3 domain-containing protein n=1 Tax=Arabidopsis lyrata subsp. lyrata TaxID=81972 RepID=D7L141_ARALL|nr:hypothetical protein ARALYDRAFT_900280 [Arabidopsis lyrata subsp. lyrata]